MGVTSGAGTAYPSGAPDFIPFLSGFVCSVFSFLCYILLTIVCLFVLFILVIVCTSVIYHFWFVLFILVIVCTSVIYHFWFVLFILVIVCTSVIYHFWFVLFILVIVCTSVIYHFWFVLFILVIVLSVLLWFTTSDLSCLFWSLSVLLWFTTSDLSCLSWSLYCLYFCDLPLLICPVYFGYCLYFCDLPLLICPVYFGHCIVCTSVIYHFWFVLFILVIVLSVPLWFTTSDLSCLFWSLYCLYLCDLPLLICPVYFGHCIVCTSVIYHFWFVLFILVIVLSALLWFTTSDLSCLFWSLYCLYFCDLPFLICPVYFGHCIVCTSVIYHFWLTPFCIFKLFLM